MIKILAIDDNKDNLLVLKAILSETLPEAQLIPSESGVEGLRLLESEQPDLVLLDLIMPGLDGFGVLKIIKSSSEPYTPVIILTAAGSHRENRIKALELGADAFLTKPVDEVELTAQIRAMLRIKEMEDHKRREAEMLAGLVDEKTRELKRELRERKKTEAILRESEERFRTIFEKSGMGIVLVSKEFKYLRVNDTFCRMVGYSAEQLEKMTVADITHPDDFEESKRAGRELWTGIIDSYRAEKKYISNSGSILWVFIAVNVIRDSDNKPLFFLTMINNITDKKIAEENLAREKVLLRTLIDNLPQTIYVKDLQKRKLLLNKADLKVIGKPENEVIGRTDAEVFPEELALKYEADDDIVLSEGRAIIDREEVIAVDGARRWFLTSKLPFYDHTGKLAGLVGIGHDITNRKHYENELIDREKLLREQNEENLKLNRSYQKLNTELMEILERIKLMNTELQKAKEKAEESDRLKTAFLHNISHEIRTPLNAIVGFSSILAGTDISNEKKKEFIGIISSSNDQLLAIITNIITLASLESGQEKADVEETDLNELLFNVYKQFQVTKISDELRFSYHKGLPDGKSGVLTDRVKLMQILVNLVGNALKFTSKGYVEFGYNLREGMVDLFVKDSGIGIPENMHDEIFKRFFQVDSSATRKYGGTGLGLAISKGYAELLGGSINVISGPGKGSEFHLRIPYKRAVHLSEIITETKPERVKFSDAATVVVAEDELFNYMLVEEILSMMNIKVRRAENGLEAVNICCEAEKPDLVLMDIKMPVMDGIEATKKIKSIHPELPVIAVTAYASESDKRKIMEAGFDDYLPKPLKHAELREIVARYLK